jgi:hypothetical protein
LLQSQVPEGVQLVNPELVDWSAKAADAQKVAEFDSNPVAPKLLQLEQVPLV